MTDSALESFIEFCDDMAIAEEGTKNMFSNVIDKLLYVITTLQTKIKSFLVGFKKNKILYLPKDAIDAWGHRTIEVSDIRGRYATDKEPDHHAKVYEARFMGINISKYFTGDFQEVSADPYVRDVQDALKLTNDFRSMLEDCNRAGAPGNEHQKVIVSNLKTGMHILNHYVGIIFTLLSHVKK